MHKTIILVCLSILLSHNSAVGQSSGEATKDASDSPQIWQETVQKGVDYLRIRGQADDGSFSSKAGIGPTGLAVAALLSVGVPQQDPLIANGLAYLEKHVQADGGIYQPGSSHRNYDTCIAMVAFAEADRDKYSAVLKRAEAFVKGVQWDESEDRDPSDLYYGGAGYGSHERPDLSNTAFFVEALHQLGNGPEDEAIQKALIFVSRCQNLESKYSTAPFSAKIDDGGFYYTVAAGGESKAGETPNGGLRSYGSMTYAGLKSMIYAGLTKDDPRVSAAVNFLREHYTLESNPGVGQQGLFYYYHTMAKALDALGGDTFADAEGKSHRWQDELVQKLAETQQADGSWLNPTSRWMEGDPNLVTAYSLLALSYCKP